MERLPPGMLRPVTWHGRRPGIFGTHRPCWVRSSWPTSSTWLRCWQALLMLLHTPGTLRWRSNERLGTRQGHAAPDWWERCCKDQTYDALTNPTIRAVTGATARHEVIEAMRWARSLLAQGVDAADIAFAAASPGEYDDLVLAMGVGGALPIHFAHGRRALTTRDGQAAAALADIVLHGLSQDRVRRLAELAQRAGHAVRPAAGGLAARPAPRSRRSARRSGGGRRVAGWPAAATADPAARDRPARTRDGSCGQGRRNLPARRCPPAVAPGPAECPGHGAGRQPGRAAPDGNRRCRDRHRLDARCHPGLLPATARLAVRPERPHLAPRRYRGPAAARPRDLRREVGAAAGHRSRPPCLPSHSRHHRGHAGVLRQPARRHRPPAWPVAANARRAGAVAPGTHPGARDERAGPPDGPARRVRDLRPGRLRRHLLGGLERRCPHRP